MLSGFTLSFVMVAFMLGVFCGGIVVYYAGERRLRRLVENHSPNAVRHINQALAEKQYLLETTCTAERFDRLFASLEPVKPPPGAPSGGGGDGGDGGGGGGVKQAVESE